MLTIFSFACIWNTEGQIHTYQNWAEVIPASSVSFWMDDLCGFGAALC